MSVIRSLASKVLTRRVQHRATALAAMVAAALATSPASARAGGGYASIVMHARTGEVLHAHQADARRDPAGLVKIMTVYLALHHVALGEIGLADRVRASAAHTGRTTRRLDALISDMLARDDDEAARAVAVRLAHGVGRFADRMHAQALRLDLEHTAFTDPAGDERDHATARDLARLVRALLFDFPEHATTWSAAAFADARDYPRGGIGVMRVRDGAGRGHGALAVRRDGDTLVVIVLGAPTPAARDAHAAELLARAFEVLAQHARSEQILAERPPRPLAMAALGPLGPRNGLRRTRDAAKPAAAPAAFREPQDAPPDTEDDAAHDDAEEEQERIRIILEGEAEAPPAAPATAAAPSEPVAGPAAAARPPAEGVSYGVQVGAYADRARAEVRLSVVQDVWPKLFQAAEARAIPAQVDGALVWRARFYDLSKAEANAACAALRDEGQGCLLLTVSREDRAALGAPD